MDTLRIGIIGMGNIGKHHAGYLLKGDAARCELTAVCSTSPHKLNDYKDQGLKVYGDAKELIADPDIDAVIVATPHYQHTELGIAAFEAGKHLMVEKPISAHKADAEKLIVSADNRFSANSKEIRVRVDDSKKRFTTVIPRKGGTFLIGRSRTSLNCPAVSRISWISSAL